MVIHPSQAALVWEQARSLTHTWVCSAVYPGHTAAGGGGAAPRSELGKWGGGGWDLNGDRVGKTEDCDEAGRLQGRWTGQLFSPPEQQCWSGGGGSPNRPSLTPIKIQ